MGLLKVEFKYDYFDSENPTGSISCQLSQKKYSRFIHPFFPYTGNGHSWHLFSVIAFHGDKANQTSSNDIWGTPFIDSTTAQSHENVSLLISTKKLFVIYWMGPFYRQN